MTSFFHNTCVVYSPSPRICSYGQDLEYRTIPLAPPETIPTPLSQNILLLPRLHFLSIFSRTATLAAKMKTEAQNKTDGRATWLYQILSQVAEVFHVIRFKTHRNLCFLTYYVVSYCKEGLTIETLRSTLDFL